MTPKADNIERYAAIGGLLECPIKWWAHQDSTIGTGYVNNWRQNTIQKIAHIKQTAENCTIYLELMYLQ